jgi:hypothetical protein
MHGPFFCRIFVSEVKRVEFSTHCIWIAIPCYFLNKTNMKKSIVSVLLVIIAVLGGCGGSKNSVTGVATAQLIPPQMANQPIRVTTQPGLNPDHLSISGRFVGPNLQSVTVTQPTSANSFSSPNTFTFGATAPRNGTFITISANVIPGAYTSVVNSPNIPLNNTGFDTTTYSDVSGDTVVIMVQDLGN